MILSQDIIWDTLSVLDIPKCIGMPWEGTWDPLETGYLGKLLNSFLPYLSIDSNCNLLGSQERLLAIKNQM